MFCGPSLILNRDCLKKKLGKIYANSLFYYFTKMKSPILITNVV